VGTTLAGNQLPHTFTSTFDLIDLQGNHLHLEPISGLFNFSTSTLTGLLDRWGYPLVTLFVGIESTGIPFPGETMLVTAAVYAGSGHLSITGVIIAGTIGAIIGDNLGYAAGRYGGRVLVTRYGRYIRLRPEHLASAERFFERHGDKTVFFGRFIAILRAWAAFLAGMNRMYWPKFLFFNAAGGITWATAFGMLGYVLGNNLPLLHRIISIIGIGGVVVVAIVAVVAFVVWQRRRSSRERRTDEAESRGRDAGSP
jgi:membrane protein DedA with SNARE-associated domain